MTAPTAFALGVIVGIALLASVIHQYIVWTEIDEEDEL